MKNKGEIIFYHPESTLKMEVRIENENRLVNLSANCRTIWCEATCYIQAFKKYL